MMKIQSLGFATLAAVLSASIATAETARQVMWADLVPKSAAMENPFTKLSRDQLVQISDIAAVRDRKARGDKSITEAEIAVELATTRRMEQAGVDVNGLLAMRSEIAERGRSTNSEIDGKLIRLPGYLLPLDFSGKLVSEFLLVPWVGACIHTPPPPPNQIVHVRPEKPIEMMGVYAPVWVTGKMSTGALTKTLSLIDGTSDINVGYSLKASSVEPYKQ